MKNVHASIYLVAYQRGGDVNKLKDLFQNKVDTDTFYKIGCKIGDMQDCLDISKKLDEYASKDFLTQFDLKKPETLSNFDIGQATWESLSNIGLKLPSSVVNEEVRQIRQILNDKYDEGLYYLINSGQL